MIQFISLSIILESCLAPHPFAVETEIPQPFVMDDDVSTKALKVLQIKCNVCHGRQNPRKVFTRENMGCFAPKIHRQVFVKKRMPKGKKIKLTAEEYQILSPWITSTKLQ